MLKFFKNIKFTNSFFHVFKIFFNKFKKSVWSDKWPSFKFQDPNFFNFYYEMFKNYAFYTYTLIWITWQLFWNEIFPPKKKDKEKNEKEEKKKVHIRLINLADSEEISRSSLKLQKITHPFYIAPYTEYIFIIICAFTEILHANVNYFHEGFMGTNIWIHLIVLAGSLFCWYKDLTFLGFSTTLYTTIIQENLLISVILFIISEIMIFFGLFWAFFHSSLNPSDALGSVWPPANLEVLEWWKWPTLSTALLVYSGFSVNSFFSTLKSLSLRAFFLESRSIPYFVKEVLINKNFESSSNMKTELKKEEISSFGNDEMPIASFEWMVSKKKFISSETSELNKSNYKHLLWEQGCNISNSRKKLIKHIATPNITLFGESPYEQSILVLLIHFSFIEWKIRILNGGLVYTLFMGGLFLLCQNHEYSHASFDITDGVYASVFYGLTGLHGLHVIAGLIFLFIILIRFIRHPFNMSNKPHVGVTAAVWYWHFVDIVWIFLYLIVYIWGNSTSFFFIF